MLILGGLGCGGCMGAYSLFAFQFLSQVNPEGAPPGFDSVRPMMTLTGILYFGFGLGVAWLGVGSILTKRWAWKLAVSLGWLWVLLIVLTAVSYSFVLPQFIRQMSAMASSPTLPGGGSSPPPAGGMEIAMIVGMAIGLLFYLTPGVILIVIYSLRSARTTCEYRDPKPRWTDAVPIPVLMLWLLFVILVFGLIAFAPAYWGLISIPGMGVRPPIATAIWAIIVPLLILAIRDLGAMRPRGWWISITVTIVGTVGSVAVMQGYDIMEVYRDMKFDEAQLKQMESIVSGLDLWIPAAAAGTILTGYVFWLKRFFQSA